MAFDETLADRLRTLLAERAGVTEKRMFGGLAFFVHGNMAIAASGQGGLLGRVAPEEADRWLDGEGVEPMVMRGRPMRGWLRVATEQVRTKRQLQKWVELGFRFAASLPEKS